jgi:hypothetical protein
MRVSEFMPKLGQCYLLDERVDDLVGSYALTLRFIGQHQAMSQTVMNDCPHILRIDIVSLL